MSFFEELRRRNVFRVGIAYLIGAWLIIQVADVVLENIGAPDWVIKAIFLVVALGFLVALFFSWAFEVTPEGIKPESEVDRTASITTVTGRKLNKAIIVMLFLALGYFIWESRLADRSPTAVTTEASVAVLAFKNMSPDPENAFFAEGISEEILNVLAAIDGLRVASRTSAFSFADSDTPIPDIASQLGVATILEGSVRKQGTRVRITAQLIDAGNDAHLWSEVYDRDLDDIFAVQEEIAVAISDALMGALGIQSIAVSAPTDDLAAYELFLRGRQQFYARGYEPLLGAAADLQAAVDRDPEFADAWSFLAATLRTIPGYHVMPADATRDYQQRAAEAAARALTLDPNQALAIAAQGLIAAETERLEGLRLLKRAADLAPNNAGIQMWLGNELFQSGGYLDESLPVLEKAYRLDPLSGINNGVLGIAYLAAGNRELGYQHIERAAELGWPYAIDSMALDLLARGDTEAAVNVERLAFPENKAAWTDSDKAEWSIIEGVLRGELSAADVEEGVANDDVFSDEEGWDVFFYHVLGDYERMFDAWLKIDFEMEFLFRTVYIPSGRGAMQHPKMIELAEKRGLLAVWEQLGFPFDCERVQDDIGDHLSCPDWPE